ncbi:hypothetical protein [Methylocystis sp. SC2]|uniref:hypothetical protein n=1 Tax=Methylocystis sp. (strain SC2) TaxID=187303 RepID=UPI0005A554EC|nr:hypothetical protein [Methylocystis sp. SC2]
MTYSIKQISRALGLSRARIDQWISRGVFDHPNRPALGLAREWEFRDVARVALTAEIAESKVGVSIAASFSRVAADNEFPDCFFVVFQNKSIPTGLPAQDERDIEAGLVQIDRYWWACELVQRERLTQFFSRPEISSAVVVDLGNLMRRLQASLTSIDSERAVNAAN